MRLQKDNKILREKSEEIKKVDFAKLGPLISKMSQTMFAEPDGIGIAAPQMGVSKKIFLVSEDVLNLEKLELRMKNKKTVEKNYLVFINPVIKKTSSKKKQRYGRMSFRTRILRRSIETRKNYN